MKVDSLKTSEKFFKKTVMSASISRKGEIHGEKIQQVGFRNPALFGGYFYKTGGKTQQN